MGQKSKVTRRSGGNDTPSPSSTPFAEDPVVPTPSPGHPQPMSSKRVTERTNNGEGRESAETENGHCAKLLCGELSYPQWPFQAFWLFFSLLIILFSCRIAYSVRLDSVRRYGYIIHEFDPWFNYRATEYLSKHGWHAFFHWFDRNSWYPIGRPVGTTTYPGLQITSVLFHRVLSYLTGADIGLMRVCVLIPAWFGTIATIFTGLLAFELNGSVTTAAITCFTFSILPAHLMRSMAGEFDNECIAVAAIAATFYFWVRSLRTHTSWPIGIFTGLAYGYLVAAWGGYIFALNMIALHAVANAVVDWCYGRYHSSLLKAYCLFFVVGTGIAVRVPPVGWSPFKSLEQLSAVAALIFLLTLHVSEWWRKKLQAPIHSITGLRVRMLSMLIVFAGVLAVVLVLAPQGYFGPLSSRVRALFLRHKKTGNPLVDSVAEHQPTQSSSYHQYLQWCLYYWCLATFYLVFNLLQSPSPSQVFVLLYSLATFYFSRKMSRLLLLTGPIACLCTGYVFGSVLDAAMRSLFWKARRVNDTKAEDKKEVDEKNKKSMERRTEYASLSPAVLIKKASRRHPVVWACVCWSVAAFVLYLLFGSGFISYNRAVAHSFSQPVLLFEASIRNRRTGEEEVVMVRDYLESYMWLLYKTPEDARILSWWDYGYQITGISGRTTLADGNTWNHEHIATIGKLLTSPIEEAHSLARHLADYVLVWVGQKKEDLLKSPHMARIANSVYRDVCPDDPLCETFGFHGSLLKPSVFMRRSLLYHLVMKDISEEVVVPENLFKEVYTSKYGLVRIYQIMNVSAESKEWVADPANHRCSEKDPWICPGQFPPAPELQEMLAKRRDFGQLEDFNRNRRDDEYYKAYLERHQRRK